MQPGERGEREHHQAPRRCQRQARLAAAFGPEHERQGQREGCRKYGEIDLPVPPGRDAMPVAQRIGHGDEDRSQRQVQHEDAGVVRQQRRGPGARPRAPCRRCRARGRIRHRQQDKNHGDHAQQPDQGEHAADADGVREPRPRHQ